MTPPCKYCQGNVLFFTRRYKFICYAEKVFGSMRA